MSSPLDPRPRALVVLGLLAACGPPDRTNTGDPTDVTPAHTGSPTIPAPTADTAGEAGALRVELPPPPGIRDLVAIATTTDGSSPALSFEWRLNGGVTGHTSDRVPARELWPGDEWTVRVTPDGNARHAVEASVVVAAPPGGNVLLVVVDDFGLDKFNGSEVSVIDQRTPTLDRLTAEGVNFLDFYVSPICSPTRSALLTGRQPGRTGIGDLVEGAGTDELSLEAITIPEALAAARAGTYATSAIGKYHLAAKGSESGLRAPNLQGFQWYAGSNDNLAPDPLGYYDWTEITNGVAARNHVYATTETVDDALARVAAMPEPWFLLLAFNAPHAPFHVPPPELHTADGLTFDSPLREQYDAALEAMDTELGRFLASVDPAVLAATTIVLMGDNGTPKPAVQRPFDPDRFKHAVYEGGTHVPLIVTGPHVAVPGSTSRALVHVTDVLATVADLAGVPLTEGPDGLAVDLGPPGSARTIDGRSLLPILRDPAAPGERAHVVVQDFSPVGAPPYTTRDNVTIVDGRWKLVRTSEYGVTGEELFDLDTSVVDEGADLLPGGLDAEQQAAYDRLSRELDAELARLVYEGF